MNLQSGTKSYSQSSLVALQLQRVAAEIERRRRLKLKSEQKAEDPFLRYQSDPIAFGCEVLGETYYPEVEAVFRSVRDNPWTIAKSATGVGKTFAAASIAVWFYKCFPGAQVYTAAAPPQDNLETLLWGEIEDVVQRHPGLFIDDDITRLNIERGPRSFITGVTIPASGSREERIARFSGKHAPNLLFILDEGDAIPDEVYEGIEGCISGGLTVRVLVMFNPKIESGPVYIRERDRRANVVSLSAFDHPNVRSGEQLIPGAVTQEATVRRLNEWSRPLMPGEKIDADSFEVPEFLVGKTARRSDGGDYDPLPAGLRKITEQALHYMTFGRYPTQSSQQLISRAWIDRARANWDRWVAEHGEIPPAGIRPKLGLDVAEQGDDSNAAAPRYGWFLASLETWSGVDTVVTGDRASELYRQLDCEEALVDATGTGAGVAPQMRREGCTAYGVKVGESPTFETDMGQFAQLRDQLYWSYREWLRTNPNAAIPPDEQLTEESQVLTYSVDKKGKIKVMTKDVMKAKLRRSPDRLDAVCMTFAPITDPQLPPGNIGSRSGINLVA